MAAECESVAGSTGFGWIIFGMAGDLDATGSVFGGGGLRLAVLPSGELLLWLWLEDVLTFIGFFLLLLEVKSLLGTTGTTLREAGTESGSI